MTESAPRVCTFYHTSQINSSNDDDNWSNETSTLFKASNPSHSTKTLRYINPASIIESDYSLTDDLDSLFEGMTNTVRKSSCSYLKLADKNSPEMISKRKEAYDKWLKSVKAREHEKKRVQKEKEERDKEAIAKMLEDAKASKAASEEKVRQWMKKKEIEAQKKLTRLNELKKQSSDMAVRKAKDFKKAIDFQQWIEKKNNEIKAQKRADEEYKKRMKDYQACRSKTASTIYNRWREETKNVPRPVPMSQGLDSLRGSTTKIFINPIPWKFLD